MTRALGLILLAFALVLGLVGVFGLLVAVMNFQRWGVGPLVAFAVVDVASVVLLLLAVSLLRRGKPLGEVRGSGAGYPAGAEVVSELDGTSYTTLYKAPVKGKHSQPSSLRISTPVATTGQFQMTVETWFDKLCKRFGIATEIQTGDEAFDEACYVRSDAVEFTSAYLQDPVKRVAIIDLRRFGFPEVTLKDGVLSATWIGFDPARHDRPDLAADVAARLVILARELPAHQPEFDTRVGTHRKQWQIVLWAGLVVYALTVIASFAFPPVAVGELLLHAAPLLLLLPGFAYASAWLLSGTSTSHTAWAGLMIGAFFLSPFGCVGTIALTNAVLDSSQPVVREAVVVDKHTTRSKNKTNYHVRCASWRDPGDTISFQVSSREYSDVVTGKSKMIVETHAGKLGVEWIKSKHLRIRP